VDHDLLISQLEHLERILGTSENIPEITIKTGMGRTKVLDVEGKVGSPLSSDQVWVVVEGFILFAEPKLVKMLSYGLWLDMDEVTGAARRFKREGYYGPPDMSNQSFVRYQNGFYKHVYEQYVEHRDLQLNNVKSKLLGRIDASPPAEQVAARAVEMLNAALDGGTVPIAGLISAALCNPFGAEATFDFFQLPLSVHWVRLLDVMGCASSAPKES